MASLGKLAALSFPDLIRTAYGRGVVRSEWEAWSAFRNMRNISSHTYDPKQAAIVLGASPAFLEEARFMLGRMQAEPAP